MRQLDLTDSAGVQPAIDELSGALGGLDAFVNNAGGARGAPFLEIDLADWDHALQLNLTGAMLAAQAAARLMVGAGTRGRIVNVTSVHEHVPLGASAGYVAAKHGLGGLTKCMALELAPHAITVNAVAPGEIATAMNDLEDVDPHTQRRPGIPLARPGDAREVAELIAFLASPEASYITGTSYVVDGGLLLMAAEANRLLG